MAAFFFLAILALISSIARASDPAPLQDFCIADTSSTVFVNGMTCKDPSRATPEDFFFSGLDHPGNTSTRLGASITAASIPGLNTLGLTLARLDFGPRGLIPPHSHPRATEVITVLEGTLYVGFVTTEPGNRLFSKVLKKGDVFVFPQGLMHFQSNHGDTDAVAIVALSSQNPGIVNIPTEVFGSKPAIDDDVLAKAFQLDKGTVGKLKELFARSE